MIWNRFTKSRHAKSSGRTHHPAPLGEVNTLMRQFNPLATEDDIYYCFRLLLGRAPSEQEWPGHSSRAGTELKELLPTYLNSLEFANRGLLRADATHLPELYMLEKFAIYARQSDYDVGAAVAKDMYEPHVTQVFKRALKPGMVVLDIGANIGYFSMLAAALVEDTGHVYAIEPNPENIKLLEASRRANKFNHVTPYQLAAGRQPGLLVLHAAASNGTTATPSQDFETLMQAVTVPALPIDTLLSDVQRLDFVKLDIEGAEFNALLGARRLIERFRPFIVSEFSPPMMRHISGVDGEEYLQWLVERDYLLGVVQKNGKISDCGTDIRCIMNAFDNSGVDHIDIFAQPRSREPLQ